MEPGINIDNETLIFVLKNKLAQAAVREAELEAAVQSAFADKVEIQQELMALKDQLEPAEVQRASADE